VPGWSRTPKIPTSALMALLVIDHYGRMHYRKA
jgi:hypothetical protein